jgi:hypothetical protein
MAERSLSGGKHTGHSAYILQTMKDLHVVISRGEEWSNIQRKGIKSKQYNRFQSPGPLS